MKVGDTKEGKRSPDDITAFAEGDYGRISGVWHARPPGGDLGSLARHKVEEHKDGTITVSPSILIHHPPDPPWHGYLRRGVWEREP